MARIAVGGFQHETNTFSPQLATWEEFERADAWPPFLRGAAMVPGVEGFNIPIAGAIKTLMALGHEVVPLCWCAAPPSSYVTRDAYEKVAGWMIEDLRALGPFDAVYLDLHGAMVAEHHQDGEGELMRRVRAVVGDAIPLVASLDYHTNMTPEMVHHATAMIGYRTYPHVDMADTGSRAAELLDRLLKDKRPLHKAYRQFDFLIPLVWQCTLQEPARSIFALLDDIERGAGGAHNQGIVSLTHTPGFPPADIAQCGPALVVYGHDKAATEAAADRLADAVRSREAAFAGRLYTPDEAAVEAIRLARTASRPIVLADVQDNPGAGGTSDTVGLLRALVAHRAQGAVIGMMVDPAAAQAAAEAGEGAVLRRGIGAAVGYAGETPVEARWRVVKVGSGVFTGTGPFYGGARFQIGPMALVTDEDSGVSVVLASKRIQAADQEMFRHVGVEPGRTPILGLKSTVHFRADFQPIAETILVVQSPGAHVTDPVELPYAHLRQGIRLRPLGPVRA
ncbi:M81 family metallopeptidase [Vineibacter terrae]|uniref:M81 family metallopeptidase n=1 Tax=Vineibacter terrae TaxID=2586908 RepID=UPI002E303B34|nr:M81 family metallopeptidase [Vineibacter terrae]HEX2885025.1 M81 family metallopeptidase [Vineibacter terrae]